MSISSIFWQDLATRSWALWESSEVEILCQELREIALSQEAKLRPARIGQGQSPQEMQQIRSDLIHWQDFSAQTPIFKFLQALKDQLNQNFFLGIQDWECHFARYPAGARYDWHLDQASLAPQARRERLISFIFYLNPDWRDEDGGELEILGEDPIAPRSGRLVLFRSATVKHQVRESRRSRWSLTGWFLRSTL